MPPSLYFVNALTSFLKSKLTQLCGNDAAENFDEFGKNVYIGFVEHRHPGNEENRPSVFIAVEIILLCAMVAFSLKPAPFMANLHSEPRRGHGLCPTIPF